jgi:hypothetical protein
MDLETRVPGGQYDNAGEEPSAKRISPPGKAERWFPHSSLSLSETKTRLDISAKRIYKNCSN